MKKQKNDFISLMVWHYKLKYQLSNVYICNQGYCFKNSFILVRDISQEVVLGTPFITQIYPFKVDHIGEHTEIMETITSSKFVTSIPQNDLPLLQNASITRQINVIECNNPKYWYKLEQLKSLNDSIMIKKNCKK